MHYTVQLRLTHASWEIKNTVLCMMRRYRGPRVHWTQLTQVKALTAPVRRFTGVTISTSKTVHTNTFTTPKTFLQLLYTYPTSKMRIAHCWVPNCTYKTPWMDTEIGCVVLMLAHTNFHLIAHLAPTPPPPTVALPRIFPHPLPPLSPLIMPPVPPFHLPVLSPPSKRRPIISTPVPKRFLPPGFRRNLELSRKNFPTEAQLAASSNTIESDPFSTSESSGADTDLEVKSELFILDVKSIAEDPTDPFTFDAKHK